MNRRTGQKADLAVLLPGVLLAAVAFDIIIIIGGFYIYGKPTDGGIAPEFAEGTGLINRCLTTTAGLALLLANPFALVAEAVACLVVWHRTRWTLPLVAVVATVPVVYWLTFGREAGTIWQWVLGH